MSIIFFFNGNARVHVTWFFGQNFLVPLSATQHIRSPFPFFFCDFDVHQIVFSTPSNSIRDIFSNPPPKKNFLKKKLREKHTKKNFFFCFLLLLSFGNWSLCSSVIRPTTHTHIHTHTKNKQTTQRNFENKRSRFSVACFLPWVERNHRVYTQKTKKLG